MHEVGGVAEPRVAQDANGVRAELPDRRAIADRALADQFLDGRAAAPHDLDFLGFLQVGRRLVQVPVKADLVSVTEYGFDHVGILLGDPARREERGLEAEPLHQFEDAGRADIDLELAARSGDRLVEPARNPRRVAASMSEARSSAERFPSGQRGLPPVTASQRRCSKPLGSGWASSPSSGLVGRSPIDHDAATTAIAQRAPAPAR